MATEHQIEMAVTRMLVTLNNFKALGLDHKATLDFWTAAQAEGKNISEEQMKAHAATLEVKA